MKLVFEVELFQLAIERGSAEAEPARDLRHLAIIVPERVGDGFALYVLERTDMAVRAGEGDRAGAGRRRNRRWRGWARRGRSEVHEGGRRVPKLPCVRSMTGSKARRMALRT